MVPMPREASKVNICLRFVLPKTDVLFFALVEEVLNFVQSDLVSEDVMILDCGETLFVWLGRESNRQEREAVLTTAKDYLLSDPSGRDVDIPVILVKQGHEPPHFTGYFGAWDSNLWPVNRNLFLCFFFCRTMSSGW